MASSYTTNYNLDKYVGTDKPNLRDQYNAAMDKIDTALLAANTNATEAKAATLSFQGDLDAVSDAVSAETTARQNADTALAASVSANATAISNEITARQTAVSNEATARQNADTALADDIADNTTAINNETTARQNADSALSARISAVESKDNFVLFGDSWADFNGGFENWYQLAGIGRILDVNLFNFAVSGASFIVQQHTITEQLATANSQMTAEQKAKTKYVCVNALVNDMPNTNTDVSGFANALINTFTNICSTFPNAKVVWAPSMCSPRLNKTRAAKCFYEALYRFTNDLQYINGNVSMPINLPYFWVGHESSEVFRSDFLHLNESGAKSFGKQVLNCFAGTESILKSTFKVNNIVFAYDSKGNITVHGNMTFSGTSPITLISGNNKVLDCFLVNQLFYELCMFKGLNGGAIASAWIRFDGTNVMACASQALTMYF